VVVQDTELFDPAYPTVLVVPMTGDPALAIPDLTVVLQPSPSNGCKKVSYLLPQSLTCVAKTRITAATNSQITPAELQQLRQLVGLTIGGLS
jgi:mRNA interferase MazF